MKKKDENSVGAIIRRNIFTYFNAIFAALSVLLVVAGSFRSLTFLPVIIANALIGIFQQLRAKRILDKLTLITRSTYLVTRGGCEMSVAMDDLRQGDIICLDGGRQIPADAQVTEGKVSVNEALLTGEEDEIEKLPGMGLMSGSFVVSGSCRALLTRVGEESYISKLTEQAREMKEKQSEMIHDIDLIVKIAGIAIIPIGAILMYQGIAVNHESFQTSVVSMVGAVIGMIPEGLYLLVTVALAISAARLAKNKVLLHDMKSTETLARVDVLCVDKTGTITSNEMKVTGVFAPEGTDGRQALDSQRRLASYIAASNDNNITAKALKEHFLTGVKPANAVFTPFSSKVKYSELAANGEVYRLGAPEFVLGGELSGPEARQVRGCTDKGERVLAFARRFGDEFKPLLFVSLENGLRPNAGETFRYLAEQDVKVMVISGDDPRTVSSIAKTVNIPGAENYIDASRLRSDGELKDAVGRYTVFGRVKPEQKKHIVDALKSRGSRVAMTGDGVNDILAMKEADCSVAMGAGSDAAMQAAQIVLLDSDFSHMRDIIAEGRRDINNLTRSATLFLYKNIFSMLLALFSIINAFTYPLQPSQVSLVSMFNIGVPAFLLALEFNGKKQHGRFIRVALMRSMPAALTSFAAIAALVVFGRVFLIRPNDVGVASTFLLSAVGFMILIRLCSPMNAYRRVVLCLCVAGFILCAVFAAPLFAISHVSYQCVMLAAVFAIAQESLMRNLTVLFEIKDPAGEEN
jgi:cation-transporting ATPase E